MTEEKSLNFLEEIIEEHLAAGKYPEGIGETGKQSQKRLNSTPAAQPSATDSATATMP